MYKITKPKLKTSDLKILAEIIFFDFILTNSGARNGTVPNIVAYSTDSPSIILQLPTSHNLIIIFFESNTKTFSGFMSQWAILFFYKLVNALKRKSIIPIISCLLNLLPSFILQAIKFWRFISAHYITIYAYLRLLYWLISNWVRKYP